MSNVWRGSFRSWSTLTFSNTRLAFVLVATLFAAPAFGQSFVGEWTATTPGGDRFSYKRTIATRDGDVVFTYAGVVSGDKFTGTAEVGGFQVPYNGVRAKAGK